jgi:hypothetical protein
MTGTLTTTGNHNRNTIVVGVLLLAGGLILNYLFERHNPFKVWENSTYPISWADLFYAPLCVFLSLTGIVVVAGAMRRIAIPRLRRRVFATVIPLTISYILFSFAMQFIATGADRLGECSGIVEAASSSNVIPESRRRPGHPAVGCGVQRRGIFLSFYNDIAVVGVTDEAAQQRVVDDIAEYYRRAHTHPVQVRFYEKEIWSTRQLKNGAFGSGGPSNLIRVVNIG